MNKKGGGGGGREYHNFTIFCRKFFCLTVPKNFVGEPFCAVFQKISKSEKFYASDGYVTIFCQNFLSHSAEKFRRGTP